MNTFHRSQLKAFIESPLRARNGVDRALFVGNGNYCYRLSQEDGSVVWKYNCGGTIAIQPSIHYGAMCCDRNFVYVPVTRNSSWTDASGANASVLRLTRRGQFSMAYDPVEVGAGDETAVTVVDASGRLLICKSGDPYNIFGYLGDGSQAWKSKTVDTANAWCATIDPSGQFHVGGLRAGMPNDDNIYTIDPADGAVLEAAGYTNAYALDCDASGNLLVGQDGPNSAANADVARLGSTGGYSQIWSTMLNNAPGDGQTFAVAAYNSSANYAANFAGTSTLQPRLFKLNGSGTVQWSYGLASDPPGSEFIQTIAVDEDGNVYVGFTRNNDWDDAAGRDANLIKLDSSGNYVWHADLPDDDEVVAAVARIHPNAARGRHAVSTASIVSVASTGNFTVTMKGETVSVPGVVFDPLSQRLTSIDLVTALQASAIPIFQTVTWSYATAWSIPDPAAIIATANRPGVPILATLTTAAGVVTDFIVTTSHRR